MTDLELDELMQRGRELRLRANALIAQSLELRRQADAVRARARRLLAEAVKRLPTVKST